MILFTDQLQRANSDDPIVDSSDVKGGFITVETESELDKIQISKLKDGMLAFAKDTLKHYTYSEEEKKWKEAKFGGGGIPIYTLDLLDKETTKPEDYILIRDADILNNSKEVLYVDSIFSALRKLLAEVSRLKNSFKYGINSYTETNTAMSQALGQMTNPEEEPLWSLEEEDLSGFEPCTISMDYLHKLNGTNIEADNEAGILHINGHAWFEDPEDGFKSVKDSKSIIFLTTTNLNILLTLTTDFKEYAVNLKNLEISNIKHYNTLIVVSKKTKLSEEDTTLYGKNYIWIQITDPQTNTVLKSGYYNGTTLVSNLSELDSLYYIKTITFNDLDLSKFNSYVKAQDFSHEVIPNIPQESEYKLGVAHLTIRSVSNQEVLDSVKNQLLDNELIWVESSNKLCIKSKGKICNIGGLLDSDNDNDNNNNNDNTMTLDELIASLKNLGILVDKKDNGEYTLELADLTGITFIHEETGKKFDINVGSDGTLRSTEVNTEYISDFLASKEVLNSDKTLKSEKLEDFSDSKNRGFISTLRFLKDGGKPTGDAGLKSDRLKIGAIYAPNTNVSVYGCSHAYVELENTSDVDINLKGCRLYVTYLNSENVALLHKIDLTGVIKAGGTYLIRGKQYALFDDVNTVLKVKTYDQEWYVNNNLIDLQKSALAFLLIYKIDDYDITVNQQFVGPEGTITRVVENNLIDLAYVRDYTKTDRPKWAETFLINTAVANDRDYIIKNTFELDPAKQAFLALHAKDSSRLRGANKNDFKHFYIDKPIISFPNSDPTYDVSLVTPKASFENKNVSTDKTKLNKDKPNMVYCSFGIDMHKTRCFNWISVGSFDEFIWVRKLGDNLWEKFESYKDDCLGLEGTNFNKKNPGYINNNNFSLEKSDDSIEIGPYVYSRMQGRFPGDGSFYTAHKCMIELKDYVDTKTTYEYFVGRALINGSPDPDHCSETLTFTVYPRGILPKVYHITDQQGFYWVEYQTWSGAAKALATKIATDLASGDFIPVIINTGDVTQNGTRINEWLDYYLGGYDLFKQYEHMSVVGNNDLCGTDPSVLGTGDDIGKSNGYYHHLFNCYEILDNLLVKVGNTYKYIPSIYYFELVGSDNNGGIRFVNINSELTYINCADWFGTKTEGDLTYNLYTGFAVSNTTDEYTTNYYEGNSFVPIYNTLYKWFNTTTKKCIASCHEIPFTVMTLENLAIPGGTVVKANEYKLTYSRSLDGKSGSLVGSHLNQLTKYDNTCVNWFSRLLEHSKVKLVLGGHKHTYTCTYPVREFYYYDKQGETWSKNSFTDGPMEMEETLQNDNVCWQYITGSINTIKNNSTPARFTTAGGDTFIGDNINIHSSRLPIILFGNDFTAKMFTGSENAYTLDNLTTYYLPGISDAKIDGTYKYPGIVYFMCLATGYKLTSNKELPGYALIFSKILPRTTFNNVLNLETGEYVNSSSANNNLKYPMFGEVIINSDDTYTLSLARIINIQKGTSALYSDTYSNDSPSYEYLTTSGTRYEETRFGTWKTDNSSIISDSL